MSDVRRELRDGALWLTFERPAARNAMTFAMYEALETASREVNDDEQARALVITGAADAFIAGTDIAQFKDISTQVVLTPVEYASGNVIYPYEKAK